jgi:hypothetical protein
MFGLFPLPLHSKGTSSFSPHPTLEKLSLPTFLGANASHPETEGTTDVSKGQKLQSP